VALDAVAAAGRRARQAGLRPSIRLALKADNDGGLLTPMLEAYSRREDALPVELVLGGWGEQARAVRDGRADAALVYAPFDERGLDFQPLLTEPRLVALAAGDPLASTPALQLADLEDRKLPGDTDPAPRDLAQILKLIELGRIAAFLPASIARRYPRPQIAYRPVAGLDPATLAVAWPQGSRSPAVAALVRAATAAADAAQALETA
jgi:LysR substrate binding domain